MGDSSEEHVDEDEDDMSEDRSEEISQYVVRRFSAETSNVPGNDDDDMVEDRSEMISQYAVPTISTQSTNSRFDDDHNTPEDKSEAVTHHAADVSTETASALRDDNPVRPSKDIGGERDDDNGHNDVYDFNDFDVDDAKHTKENNYGTDVDTSDSDAEETMEKPYEVQIEDGMNSHTTGQISNDKNGNDEDDSDAAEAEMQQKETTDDTGANGMTANTHNFENTTDPQLNSNDSVEQDEQGLNTTGAMADLEENSGETTPPVFDLHPVSQPPEDNDSASSRSKRSLSLEQVQTYLAEGGVDHKAVEHLQLTFGNGRIRRQVVELNDASADSPRQAAAAEEQGEPVLVTWTKQPMEAKHIPLGPEEEPMRIEVMEKTKKDQPAGPQTDMVTGKFDPQSDELSNELHRERNPKYENYAANEEPNSPIEKLHMDTVMNVAVKFIDAAKLSDSNPRKHGASGSSEAEPLSAGAPNRDRDEHSRTRRSVAGHLSPERYVPLIDRLVDRLKYLKHSLAVCQALASQGSTLKKT